ncbi:MAG: MFS transporter [Actinobacteria bacterium]|nr:MFS transporter [Actinomycetota bacterium]
MAEITLEEREIAQKRTIRTLMAGLVPAGAAMSGAYSAAAVLGEELSGSETLGGLAAACMTTGSALATLPLARLMMKHGRRPGLTVGYFLASIGSLFAMFAALSKLYFLLPIGILGVGIGNAANLAARYAAADLASPDRKARAIGTLVWASTFGSVLGPTIGFGPAKSFGMLIGLPELAGPYVVSCLLFIVAGFVIHKNLHPDPLLISGESSNLKQDKGLKEAFKLLFTSSAGQLSVLSMVSGHVVMVGVMTMTPLHMKDGSHELEIIGFVISLHIVGMYAVAPVIGWIVDRIGSGPVLIIGGSLLFLGSELAAHTDKNDSLGVFVGLFLIGVGWSCGLVASSALLTKTFEGPEKVRVQGLADLIMTASGGLAGIGSGLLVAGTDYQTMSHNAAFVGLVPIAGYIFFEISRKGKKL